MASHATSEISAPAARIRQPDLAKSRAVSYDMTVLMRDPRSVSAYAPTIRCPRELLVGRGLYEPSCRGICLEKSDQAGCLVGGSC